MIEELCFNERAVTMNQSGWYKLDPKCNGYVAKNLGDTLVIVNGKPLLPPPAVGLSGESSGIQGNYGEIFKGNNGQILVQFNKVLGNVNPSVIIVEKYYI